MMRRMGAFAALALAGSSGVAAQLFNYDPMQPFDTTCKTLHSPTDVEIKGCGFSGPRGGRLSFILVTPKSVKPPFAGVLFQHGGGQSMTNYLSEALILARVGVVSMIADSAPLSSSSAVT